MRKKLSLIALLFILLITACHPDDNGPYQCKDCVDHSEAIAPNDNLAPGVYKGTIIGSTGYIKFDIANSGTAATGVLEIDGKRVTLTTTSTPNANGFQGSFTGTLNGATVTITITVSSTGVLTIVSASIPGHPNAIFSIYKEKSTQIVKVFEGTFSGDDSGTFNMTFRLNENGNGVWQAISRSNTNPADSTHSFFQGEVNSQGTMVGGGGSVLITGSLTGDNVKGEWTNTDSKSATWRGTGTWRGKRTL